MTKSEAIAITALLPGAQKNIQEVAMRLQLNAEGAITLSADSMADSMARLEKAVESILTVSNMAFAELE